MNTRPDRKVAIITGAGGDEVYDMMRDRAQDPGAFLAGQIRMRHDA